MEYALLLWILCIGVVLRGLFVQVVLLRSTHWS